MTTTRVDIDTDLVQQAVELGRMYNLPPEAIIEAALLEYAERMEPAVKTIEEGQ